MVFSGQEAMLSTVRAAGFAAAGSGGPTLAEPGTRSPLLALDRAHEERVIRDVFAGRTARQRIPALLDLAHRWRPDVVIRDEVDFGAAVAAEKLDLPHVSIIVLAAGGLIGPELLGHALDKLRTEHGLPPDPSLEMLHRHLTLVPVPPSYRTPDDPLPATAVHIQPAALEPIETAARHDESTTRVLTWLAQRPDRPTVYATLGTIFGQESGDLLSRITTALAALDANIVVTVGEPLDPAELGPQPANVRVERFIAQAALLPHCDAVVSHAGSGTVVNSLSLGVPLVLLPLGADQPLNADRCHALGVARVLDPLTADTYDIREAALRALHDPAMRAAAHRIKDDAAALPDASHAAMLIEALLHSRT